MAWYHNEKINIKKEPVISSFFSTYVKLRIQEVIYNSNKVPELFLDLKFKVVFIKLVFENVSIFEKVINIIPVLNTDIINSYWYCEVQVPGNQYYIRLKKFKCQDVQKWELNSLEKYMDWFWSNILLTKKTFVDLNKIKKNLKLMFQSVLVYLVEKLTF